MKKTCPGCDIEFKEGDVVVAEVLTVYHEIPSKRAFAVSNEFTDCLGLIHKGCYNDDIEELINAVRQ